MQHCLDLCVYCERTPAEVVQDGEAGDLFDALHWVKVGDTPLLLCLACRLAHAPGGLEDFMELWDGPIEFPPGVTAVEHTCPNLEELGKSEEEATFRLQMTLDRDGLYAATCPYCRIQVVSKAVDEVL